MTQRNVLQETVPDRKVWLPKPACVIVAVRLSKALKDAHSKEPSNLHVLPASKTPANQNIYHLNTLHLYPAQTRKRTSYQILISSCWTTEIRLFDFCRKRGLGPDQSHYNQSRLGSRLQSTLAQITRITPKWIYTVHCIENFFTVHDFWATCACPKKNRVARKFFTVLNKLFRSGFLTTCACPENRVCPEIFHCIEYIFYYSEILSNLRLRWKTECALNSLYWIYIFYYSRFLSNLRLPWKTECALKFFTALDMCFLSFRIFEQLALVLKNRVALEFFTVLRYF